MKSEFLTTLAIGGPHAGQILTGSYGLLQAVVHEPLGPPKPYPDFRPEVTAVIRTAIYREEKIEWNGENGKPVTFRFWVWEGIKAGGDEILKSLIANYRPVHVDYSL